MEVFILNVQFDPIDFVQVFMYTIISEREALRANKGRGEWLLSEAFIHP